MILYSVVAAGTILLACLIHNQPYERSNIITRRKVLDMVYLAAVFSVLFLLAAMRLEVGNDYGTYVTTCHEIFQKGYVVTEPGFNFVVRVLYTLAGEEQFLLVFAFFAFVTIFVFLKAFYEQSDSFVLSFFLFMSLGIYFRTFNTVRYYFVLAIVLYSLRYIVRKEYGRFILLILFAALFHKSVLVVIPLFILADRSFKKWQLAVLAAIGACFLIGQDFFMQLALKLYPSYVNTPYLEEGTGILGNAMSILRCVLVLILCLACYQEGVKDSRENRLYFNLNLMALGLYVFCSFVPLLSRFSYYLMTPQVLLIPGVFAKVKDEKKKRMLLGLVICIGVIYFAVFLKTASQDGVRVLPYKSWLFYEREWLDATDIF